MFEYLCMNVKKGTSTVKKHNYEKEVFPHKDFDFFKTGANYVKPNSTCQTMRELSIVCHL